MWALLAAVAVADLPVHCLRNEIIGDWTFHLGPLSDTRTSCGHSRPDLPSAQPALSLDTSTELEVQFSEPNTVHVKGGNGGSGTFSMIYDEGFDFKVDGKAFFAFSGFTLQNGVNQSHCDQTEKGWYSTADRSQFGCFYGAKKGATHQVLVRKEQVVEKPKESKVEKNVEKLLQMNYFAETTPAYHAQRVSFLNLHATTWRAKVYDQYVGKSIEWLNTRAGIRRAKIHPHGLKKAPVSLLSLQRATDHSTALKKSLPKEFDWRKTVPCPAGDADCAAKHPNGRNIIEQVMDQGDCGSCYVVSSVRMLSARHKLNTGDDAVPFSISFPLFCSEYNQGCAGGYGVLVARWSEDVGLVPATCGKYTTSSTCSAYEHSCAAENGTRYRADNHRYVGGYYGHANEGEMMQELMDNGPFVVGVEPKDDFMYYSEGVYSSGPTTPGTDGWQRVDHAVLLVGWGEENGVPYWVLQNSWDNYWGEDGYMRIKRGENDSGIESIPEAADVVVDESKGARVASFIAQA